MKPHRVGFTLLELLVVIVIGAIIAGVAAPTTTRIRNEYSVTNSRNAYIGLSHRARAVAIERGGTTRLILKPTTAAAWVIHSGGDTVETLRFSNEYGTTITTENGDSVAICYSPRGYALEACTTSANSDIDVTFTRGGSTAVAVVKPLGQVESQ